MEWEVSKMGGRNAQIFKNGEINIVSPIILENRYEIFDVLSATGGFGIIYKAKDRRLQDRLVLVKARKYARSGLFLYKKDSSRIELIKNMRNEIESECKNLIAFNKNGESRIASVNNIVYEYSPELHGPHRDINGEMYFIEDEDIINKEPYLIIQMIKGETLRSLIKGGFNKIKSIRGIKYYEQWEKCVLEIAIQLKSIFDGFHEIKERKNKNGEYYYYYYLYQDLKPDNVMITDDRFITLIDFGALLRVCSIDKNEWESNTGDGEPGTGTMYYRAPEIIPNRGDLTKLDKRVDVYSFGMLLHSLLSFKMANKLGYKEGVERVPLDILIRYYNEDTIKIVSKCTELSSDERYCNINEVYNDIIRSLANLKGQHYDKIFISN